MNVLISSASRKVMLVKSFQNALKHEGGGKVIAVDSSPLAPALYFADIGQIVPKSNSPNFIKFIKKICNRYNIKLIIPTRDEELLLFALYKEEFSKLGITILISDYKSIETCQDKKLFYKFCLQNTFDTPKIYSDSNLKQLKYPLFVKPRHGKGGIHATKVNNFNELKTVIITIPGLIIQDFVDAPEYTIDFFRDFQGKIISVVPRERIKVIGGESYIGRIDSNKMLIQKSIQLVNSLNLIGHITIQCFYAKSKVFFIEVNPRFGGGANLSISSGANTPLFIIKLMKGEKVPSLIGMIKTNMYMLRYASDLIMTKEKLINESKSSSI